MGIGPISLGGSAPAGHRTNTDSGHAGGVIPGLGDYEFIEEIARGGMGVVYRARQISLNRTVAVKLLLFGKFANDEFVQRFRTEAAAAASLQHPNIVAIHEVGHCDGQHYFSMDFVPGMNLADLVRDRPLSARRAAAYLKTIAAAVHFAHEHRVLHRDLKPSNVLIDETDRPRITDFGLAKWLGQESGFTTTGHVLGSPSYMPPEQAVGRPDEVGVHSDVYSLGSILYHLLTARPPFVGESVPETLDQVLHCEPVRPRLLNPGIPPDLDTICLKCLEKNAPRRYASAQALAEDLDRFLQGVPILARPVSPPEKVWRWCRRKPSQATVATLVMTLALGAAWTAVHLHQMQAKLLSNSVAAGEELRKEKYVSDMNLAIGDLEEGNTVQALEKLDHHFPTGGQTDLRGFEWRYLWGRCRGDYSQWLPKHRQIAGTICFSPDGKRMAIYTWDKVLSLWDLATRRRVLETREVTGFGGFSRDGSALILSRGEGLLQTCATESGSTNRLIAATGDLAAYAPNSELAVMVSEDSGLTVVDIGSGLLRFALPDFKRRRVDYGWGFPGAISPDGRTLALVQSDPNPLRDDLTIELWDLTTRKGLCVLPVARQVRSLAFSPGGKVLAVGDGEGNLLLYQVTSPEIPPIGLKAHDFPLLSLAFSNDGQILATGSSDMRSIRLWNVADGTPRPETFAGQVGDVWSLAFSPDGTRLASGTRDGPIRIWNLADRGARELVEEQVSSHEYGNFIFSPDSKWMAAGCTGNFVKVWEVATSRLITILTNTTYVVAFSSDSKSLLVSMGSSMPYWESLESPTARPVPPYRGQVNTLCAVDLTTDRRLAVLGLQSGEIQVLEIESGRPTGPTLRPHRGAVRSLALSPSGGILASGGGDKELVVTDLRTGSVLGRSFEHKGSVCAVAISPDGTLLASGCSAETLKFWQLSNISTGSTASISYHKSVIRTLAFSPDGGTLASGSEDKTVKLWNVRLHREVASFKLYDHMRLVVFSPDGNTLAAVTDGGTLRVFRAPSLREADAFARE